MSHNVAIHGVKITDISALEMAVDELRREGAHVALIKDKGFRSWMGRIDQSDYTIRLDDHQYDVGLRREADGTYSMLGEHLLDRRTSVGVTGGAVGLDGSACAINGPEAAIGRVIQRYNVVVAENEAARAGYTSTREYDNKTGQMQVVCELAG